VSARGVACVLACAQLVAVSFATALVSARGTILNAHPRRSIYILLYIRFPLFFIEVAINVYGTVAIARRCTRIYTPTCIQNRYPAVLQKC
jgi:hypothetical protein